MVKQYDKYNNTWNLAYLPFIFALGVRICPRPSALGKYGYLYLGKYVRGKIRQIAGIIVCVATTVSVTYAKQLGAILM